MNVIPENLENYQITDFSQNKPTVRIIFYPLNKTIEKNDLANREVAFLKEFQYLLEQHYTDEHFRAKQIACMMQMSESQLFKRLKTLTNQGFASYLRFYRLRKAKELIEYSKHLNISEVAYAVGFTDPNYFSRAFSLVFGQSPSSCRRTASL